MNRAIDLMEEDVCDIYKIDILSAMRALKRACTEFPGNVIKQGWVHTKISPATVQVESATNLRSSLECERSWLEEQKGTMVAAYARMAIKTLIKSTWRLRADPTFRRSRYAISR